MKLHVLYDDQCGFCLRCRAWMEEQAQLVEIQFISRRSEMVARRFPGLRQSDDELVVVDDAGQVWRGPSAFLMCLWALDDYRGWAVRLSTPALLPLARKAFDALSRGRSLWAPLAGLAAWPSTPQCSGRTS